MSPSAEPGPEREEVLRRLLAQAVEPVEPGPGAQTRLLARARAQQRRRRRPLIARLALPAGLVSLLIVLGVTVVFATRGGHGSGSSASTAAGSAPAAAGPSHTAVAAPAPPDGAHAPALRDSGSLAASPQAKAATGGTFDSNAQSGTSAYAPAPLALRPSDLDGDGRPDTFTIGAGTLAAQLSSLGLEAVSLPPLGPGAKILGTTWLFNPHGQPVPVVFVRLRQVGASSTDTVAVLENGALKIVQQGPGPVLLTIDASHGYACNGGGLAESGNPTPLVVDGAQLVASPQLRAVLVKPRTAGTGCIPPG